MGRCGAADGFSASCVDSVCGSAVSDTCHSCHGVRAFRTGLGALSLHSGMA